MQFTFSELKEKEVVNLQDGRKLGKVVDLSFLYPENKLLGIVVPNGKGWHSKKNELFIDMKCIAKIGDDVILVNVGFPKDKPETKDRCPPAKPPAPKPPTCGADYRRSYEEYE